MSIRTINTDSGRFRRTGRTAAAWQAAAVVVGAGVLACNPSSARPPFVPFVNAVIDTILAAPEPVLEALAARLGDDSITLRTVSVRDGFLETGTVNAVGDVATEPVTLRAWVDPVPGRRARLTVEVVRQWTPDPSRPVRDRERMVGPAHPVRLYLRRVLADLEDRFRG